MEGTACQIGGWNHRVDAGYAGTPSSLPVARQSKTGLRFSDRATGRRRFSNDRCLAGLCHRTLSRQRNKRTCTLRVILDCFSSGNILLGDRYSCTYLLIVRLQTMGVDAVFQQHASRKSDFRRGQRLGIKDHLTTRTKPSGYSVKSRPKNWFKTASDWYTGGQ